MNVRRITPVLLALAAAASAQSTQPTAQTLIDSLRSDDWSARQAAEDGLVALGGEATAAIEATLKDESIAYELRDRLQAVLSRIAQDQLVLATRLTVQKEFESPFAAFAYLAGQAGVTLDVQSDRTAARARSAQPIRLELANAPWLAAIQDLTARSGFAVEITDGRIRLLDQPPASLRPPTDFAGPVMISAAGVRQIDVFQFGDTARRRESYLDLVIDLEPKAKLVEPTAQLFMHRITDNAGKAIYNEESFGLSRAGPTRYVTTIILTPLDASAKGVGLVEGEVQGELVTRSEVVRITDLAALPRTVELPGGSIEIQSVQRVGNEHQIAILIPKHLDGRPAGLLIEEKGIEGLEVFDESGKPMRLKRTAAEQKDGATEYRYALTGETPDTPAASVTWSIPVSTREISIPFKLTNLPLPE